MVVRDRWCHTAGVRRLSLAFAIALATPAAAHAGGNAAAGRDKSLVCTACHATRDPAADAPHLAGQSAGYLARQLDAFRKGERTSAMMNAVATQLSDADVDDLAAFWAGQPPGSDTQPPPAAAPIMTSRMAFPRDFPSGFVLYLTANNAEQKTVRKTYINQIGWNAARAGKPLPDGSVIIAAVYAPRLGPDQRPIMNKDGTWAIDKLNAYAGMEARAGWGNDIPATLRNATWNYTLFRADKAPRAGNQAPCLACHKPQAAVSYVFTFSELWDKARGR
jgi:cytochrome c553